jgi:hypothetical protein
MKESFYGAIGKQVPAYLALRHPVSIKVNTASHGLERWIFSLHIIVRMMAKTTIALQAMPRLAGR